MVAALAATATFVLTQGVESLGNARKLPTEVVETYRSFISWYYDDDEWTGTWSSREEGHVDDYKQSSLPLKLETETKQGKVAGEMFNRSVCEANPMLPPVLVEGEIRRGEMLAVAYAYVGGEKRSLYSFSVAKSDNEPVITISPLKDPSGMLPPSARLVHRVIEKPAEGKPSASIQEEHTDLECMESPIEYLHRLRKEGKPKSVEELGIAHAPRKPEKVAP